MLCKKKRTFNRRLIFKIIEGAGNIIKKDYERNPEKYHELLRDGVENAIDYFTKDSVESKKTQLQNIEIKQLNRDVINLIPEDTDFLIHINISKILAMPEVKNQIIEVLKQPEQKKTYEELKSKSGFDPLKDLSNITLFSSAKVIEGRETIGGALIKGKFDVKKIVNVIREDKEASKDVDVKTLDGYYCIVPQQSNDGYCMFLDNQYVVVDNYTAVNAVKAIAMNKSKSVNPFSVFKQINSNATISGAGILPESFKNEYAQNPNTSFLANINTFYFNFYNDINIIFNLSAEVDKVYNVNNVITSINGYITMIKMFASKQIPELGEALNFKSSSSGTTIDLNLNIPAAKVAEIKDKLEERAKQMQESSNSPR